MTNSIAEHRYNSLSSVQTRPVALHDLNRPCPLSRLALSAFPLAFITCPPSRSSKHVDIWKRCCPPPPLLPLWSILLWHSRFAIHIGSRSLVPFEAKTTGRTHAVLCSRGPSVILSYAGDVFLLFLFRDLLEFCFLWLAIIVMIMIMNSNYNSKSKNERHFDMA